MKNNSIFGLSSCACAALVVSIAVSGARVSLAQTTPPATVPPVTAPPATAPPVIAAPPADHPNGDLPPITPKPGRRAMRMGTDPEAAKMSTKPVLTTIAAVKAFPRPKVLSATARVVPVETTIWSIEATLVLVESKPDGDFFLVLRDDAGNVMTAELPDPDLEKDCPWIKQIVEARKACVDAAAKFQKAAATDSKKMPRVRVTGAGFFGRTVAEESDPDGLRNGFQLHPATGFTPLP